MRLRVGDDGEAGGGETYQFAAIIGFPRGFIFFDLGFILIFAIEDLFFFFCSSRPMITVLLVATWIASSFHSISLTNFFSSQKTFGANEFKVI